MRGSIKRRYEGSWSLILDLGYQTDPETGLRKRRQKWITFRGTKRDAEKKLTDLLRDANRGEFVEPSKRTFGEWLTEWLEKGVKPPARRLGTYTTYKHVIEHHVHSSFLAGIPLQQIKATDLKRYYTEVKVGPSTQAQHHAILHSALKAATLEGLVSRNVASLVIGKPRTQRDYEDIRNQCWTADEARQFLAAAHAAGEQSAAFFTLALETGMR
jgi:hypothetical protein